MIDILLKYIFWYDFLNDLDAQTDFDKKFVTGQVEPFLNSSLSSSASSKGSKLSFQIQISNTS